MNVVDGLCQSVHDKQSHSPANERGSHMEALSQITFSVQNESCHLVVHYIFKTVVSFFDRYATHSNWYNF